jgi:hypothetical protein
MSEIETQWHVQVEDGLVKLWSLDQLDAAFKAGLIDESTFVLEDGTHEWQTLGALLGGDEGEAAAPDPVVAPAPAVAPASVVAPAPVVAPVSVVAPAPVVAQSYAAATPSYAPASMETPQSLTPMAYAPQSASPFAPDLDDDMPVQFRSSKKRGLVIGLSLAAVAAVVAVAGFRFGTTATEVAPVAVAAVAPPAPVADPTPAPDAAKDTSATDTSRLSDDQRRALANADKALQAKLDAQKQTRAAAAPRHHGGKSVHEKTPFHNGGAQGDPLNAKL